ncbi:MAG: hypothetical protein APF76_03480 [Desulfitibacter sp. BRH_c19]|nr:MAG: hypothetical protein APF76_03480 [Desulfitibacter sp. BRH_c19]
MGKKWLSVLLIVLLALVLVVGCGQTDDGDDGADVKGTVKIGSKEFTEQLILGQIAIQILEDNGYEVEDRTGLGGTTVCREALESGEIDLYWEYTGTAWLVALGHEEALTDSEEAYQKVKEEDLGNGMVWLPYAQFDNTYTLMMNKDQASELGIETISQLGDYINQGNEAIFGTDHEFAIRPDGLPELENVYGFKFTDVEIMDIGITYGALRDGLVPCAMGFATDGRIADFDLINLQDDKKFFPVYNPSVVIRQDTLENMPEIEQLLGDAGPLLDTETMTQMNYLVDIEGEEPEDVARQWLLDNNLLSN